MWLDAELLTWQYPDGSIATRHWIERADGVRGWYWTWEDV